MGHSVSIRRRQCMQEMMRHFPAGTKVMISDYPANGMVTTMQVNWDAGIIPQYQLVPVSKHDDHIMCVPVDRIM